jgi:hypothetical protein
VSLTIRGAANIVDHAPQGCFALLERAAPQVATVHGADASTNEPITVARRPFSSPSRALSGQLGHGRRPAVGCEMFPILYRRHRFPPRRFSMRFGLYLRFTLSYRDVEVSGVSTYETEQAG